MKKIFIFFVLLFFISCKHPYLYQINARAWLYELTKKYKRSITKLSQIPTEEFDILEQNGVDMVWMMGVWQLGEYGLEYDRNNSYDTFLPDWTVDDVIGSPFAITNYTCNPELGTDDDILNLRYQLNIRNIKLMLDFVPNHSAHDCPLAYSNPDMYILAPNDTFEKDRYSERGIAYGSDIGHFPWKDVIQFNYWNNKTIEEMKNNFVKVLTLADGVRCDTAVLELNDVFEDSWKIELNAYNYSRPEEEFWGLAIKAAKEVNPDAIFLGESYFTEHNPKLIELGFDYVYEKILYESLLENPEAIRDFIKSVNKTFLDSSCHFVENHDLERIVGSLGGNFKKAMAAGTIGATVGGMIFINHGQWEGKKNRLIVNLRRAVDEDDNVEVKNYYRKLNQVLKEPAFRSSNIYYIDNMTGDKKDDFISYIKEEGDNHFLVVVNYSENKGCAKVPIYNIKGYRYCLLYDALNSKEFAKEIKEVRNGMEVCLEAWESKIFRYNY
jgi:glycosidase